VTDVTTKDQLRIATDEIAGPYLMLPLLQLGRVRDLLDRHQIHYWADSFAISLGGKPAIIVINFGRNGDPARLQTLLDEAG